VVAVFAVVLVLHVLAPVAWGAFMLRTCRRHAPATTTSPDDVAPGRDKGGDATLAASPGAAQPSEHPTSCSDSAAVCAAAGSPTSPSRRTALGRRGTVVAGSDALARIHNIQDGGGSDHSPSSARARPLTSGDDATSVDGGCEHYPVTTVVVEPATPMRGVLATHSEPARHSTPSALPPLDADAFNSAGNQAAAHAFGFPEDDSAVDGRHRRPGGGDNDGHDDDGTPSPMRREESDPILPPGFMPRRRSSSSIVAGTGDLP
jgi:hypothetical protein